MAGNAARKAAEQIRGELVAAATRLTGYPPEGFMLKDEELIYAPNPDVRVTYMQALEEALAKTAR